MVHRKEISFLFFLVTSKRSKGNRTNGGCNGTHTQFLGSLLVWKGIQVCVYVWVCACFCPAALVSNLISSCLYSECSSGADSLRLQLHSKVPQLSQFFNLVPLASSHRFTWGGGGVRRSMATQVCDIPLVTSGLRKLSPGLNLTRRFF